MSTRAFYMCFLCLAVLMAGTRNHHFASMTHLPDASWAVFLLAGFYLRAWWPFPALLMLAGLSDYLAINWFGVSDFCISAAYGFLLPAYGALWFAGRRCAAHGRVHWRMLPSFLGFALGGAMVGEVLSSGGFYFFSGRFTQPHLGEFVDRLLHYFPQTLAGLALYLGAAVIAHVALTLAAQARLRPETHGTLAAQSTEPGA